ncbi:hypothetical protein HDU87_000341 [Geranomyces variabilis]|uniref:Pentatricopeptide repeat protein n=1 Tax=Geranomyces variabilis TaxID=109894 RepID=A0AAD5TNI5_9FUNG|nr:hypothetical protein HDU87_000341 [Geranomyces variabilis]
MLLLLLRNHPARRLTTLTAGNTLLGRVHGAPLLRRPSAPGAGFLCWKACQYSSLAAAFQPEPAYLQDAHSYPALFGVHCGSRDQPIQELVKQQAAELREAMDWYLLDENLAWPADQRRNSQSDLVDRRELLSRPEDPWVLYISLTHDPENLRHCDRELFSEVLTYIFLIVDSPQVCLDRCTRILIDMYESGVKPSNKDWIRVLRAYSRWGKVSDVHYMAGEAKRLSRLGAMFSSQPGMPLASEPTLFPHLLQTYTDEQSLFAVKMIVAEMKSFFRLDGPLYQAILEALAQVQDTNEAYRTYTELLKDGLIPSHAIYKNVLYALSLRKIVETSGHGSDSALQPSDALAEQVLAHALPHFLDASLFAYTMRVYARHNKLSHAEALTAHMQRIGLHVELRIVLTLYLLNLRHNRLDNARKIYRSLMADRTRLPDPCDAAFHRFILIAHLSCGRNFDALIQFWRTKTMGVKLDAKSLSMLVDHFAEWRPLRAHEVYVRMLQLEIEPSATTKRVIRAILEANNMEEELAEFDRREREADAKQETPPLAPPMPLVGDMYNEDFD